MEKNKHLYMKENPVSRFLLNDTRSAIFWLVIRLYVGYVWLKAGWGKIHNDAWIGENGGTAVIGFVKGALEKSTQSHDVAGWYATFLENAVLPNSKVFAFIVAYGELLVGLGLILGLLTGIAAFFGSFMNVSFLFAGTLSSNPLLFILATWLVLAWKVAGWYGLDRWVLPKLGTPWSTIDMEENTNSAVSTKEKWS